MLLVRSGKFKMWKKHDGKGRPVGESSSRSEKHKSRCISCVLAACFRTHHATSARNTPRSRAPWTTKRKGANIFMASMRVCKKMQKRATNTAVKAATPRRVRRAMRSKHDVSQRANSRGSSIQFMNRGEKEQDTGVEEDEFLGGWLVPLGGIHVLLSRHPSVLQRFIFLNI